MRQVLHLSALVKHLMDSWPNSSYASSSVTEILCLVIDYLHNVNFTYTYQFFLAQYEENKKWLCSRFVLVHWHCCANNLLFGPVQWEATGPLDRADACCVVGITEGMIIRDARANPQLEQMAPLTGANGEAHCDGTHCRPLWLIVNNMYWHLQIAMVTGRPLRVRNTSASLSQVFLIESSRFESNHNA